MIYLSGRVKKELIGERKDLGLMIGFRSNGSLSHGRHHLQNTLFALDNGCFTNPDLDVNQYLDWLKNLSSEKVTCLFATAPDVVGDAKETIKRSAPVLAKIRQLGFAAAFVAQDGLENITFDWSEFDCLFIGGTTEWKKSEHAAYLCKEARRRGKWVHMGRVNSFDRILLARSFGCHSADGTHAVFAPDLRLKDIGKWLDFINKPLMYELLIEGIG